MKVVGGILIVVAIVLVVVHVLSKKKIGALLMARVVSLPELRASAANIASELGAGGFTEFVALEGSLLCDNPLISPLGGHECAYYSMEVRRRYEETYEERDDDGQVRIRTRQSSDTMSREQRNTDFELVVGDEQIPVMTKGLAYDAKVETVDQFEPAMGYGMINFGGYSFESTMMGHGRETLGFQYEEYILPLDGRFTIVGQVRESNGELVLGDGGPLFNISRDTRDAQIGASKSRAQWTSIASGVAALGGVVCLVIGFMAGGPTGSHRAGNVSDDR